MRSLISIIAASIIMLNLFGFYAAFYTVRADVRDEMESTLNASASSQLECLTLSSQQYASIDWTRDSKEFRFAGRLYDLSKTVIENGSIKLYVVEDEKESQLVDAFLSLICDQSKKDHGTSPVTFLLQHFLQDFTPVNAFDMNVQLAVNVQRIYFSNGALPVVYCDYQSPPPKLG